MGGRHLADADWIASLRSRRMLRLLIAVGAPALVTLLALTDASPEIPRTLYIAAIAAAALGGTVPGLLAAIVSFLALSYFFERPAHTFEVHDLAEAVSLAVFAAVGLSVGQLVARERRARERSDAAAAQTRRLEAVARALSEARTPERVLDAVLTEGLAATEARAGLIGVLTEDGRSVEVIAQRGYGRDFRFERWARFGVDEQLPLSEAIRTGEPIFLPSSEDLDRRYPMLAGLSEHSHGLACLPLVFEGRTLGGLVLSFPTDQQFDVEQRALKEALAAQAAQALDRARLDEAERALRERLAFLAEASALLASSLDYEQTLRQLATLCVPRLADWCTIDMLAPDGSIEQLTVAHQDPEKVRFARELGERYPPDPEAPTGVPNVLRTGEPQFLPDIPDELLVDAAKGDDELLGALRDLELRSAILVPLLARGRTIGALSLIATDPSRRYSQADVDLAMELARRAAVAVDNARLHSEAERRADAARALDHVTDAVVLVDREGDARYWNKAADTSLGGAGWAHVRELLANERGGGTEGAVTLPVELDGRERWLQISAVPFDDGVVYALRDVTEERVFEQTRSEFVATASHELRTPIAAVYGTFQTLLREDLELGRDREEEFLRIGLQESERLREIVEDLLLVGQLEAGRPRVTPVRCNIETVVRELVESTAARINGTHSISLAVDQDVGAIECDPQRLRQVLANLIENAVKYSPDGGTVRVSAARADGAVRIAVADEGIGIAEEDQARIFERFVRLDPALMRGVGGTGLGLYISKELVERMGGRITVRSRTGEGATFTVELPAR